MKETEWTFRIPRTLKEAVKKEKAIFCVNYKLINNEVAKTITVLNLKHNKAKEFDLTLYPCYIGEELESEIYNFIYAEPAKKETKE